MPHVNIWIRKEDWHIWDALDNKPEFLHEALNRVPIQKNKEAGIRSLAERMAEEEEEVGHLDNWWFVEGQGVVDDDGEWQDVTPEDVKELKKRGRIKRL